MIKLTLEDRTLVLETRAHWVRMWDDLEGNGDAPSLATEAALVRRRRLTDEQQLPSEVTRAAERVEGKSCEGVNDA